MLLKDLWITEDGDLVIGHDGDLKVSEATDAYAQGAMFRGKTVVGDFLLQPSVGASLESLVGEPNTEETGEKMKNLILESLQHDNFINSVEVETFPVSLDTIMAVVTITELGEPVIYTVEVDLKEGEVLVSRVNLL